jgi:hypothetical protein
MYPRIRTLLNIFKIVIAFNFCKFVILGRTCNVTVSVNCNVKTFVGLHGSIAGVYLKSSSHKTWELEVKLNYSHPIICFRVNCLLLRVSQLRDQFHSSEVKKNNAATFEKPFECFILVVSYVKVRIVCVKSNISDILDLISTFLVGYILICKLRHRKQINNHTCSRKNVMVGSVICTLWKCE